MACLVRGEVVARRVCEGAYRYIDHWAKLAQQKMMFDQIGRTRTRSHSAIFVPPCPSALASHVLLPSPPLVTCVGLGAIVVAAVSDKRKYLVHHVHG